MTGGLITAEEFISRYDTRGRDLVRGRVVDRIRRGFLRSVVCTRLCSLLHPRGDAKECGESSLFYHVPVARDPDTVLRTDLSFFRWSTLPPGFQDEFYAPVPPDLVIELDSPEDPPDDRAVRTSAYLRAGVPTVLWAEVNHQRLILSTADGMERTLGPNDVLELPGLIPHLSAPVGGLLEW